ncbi:MAG TPA: TetR/AcrR family transcriptional regulator [Polyangiaceae bacterium]|nr:TetR/AcrR family transcriptional regulator [Polyangiaceae bacterium]
MGRSTGSARRTRGLLGGRSEQVVRRVLDAAIIELARSGYAGFRMNVVASRAAVNKTTIYRRWPTRLALVTALVDRMRTPLRERPLPDTGQLESDLIQAFTRRFTVGRTTEGRAWVQLLDERHSPEVEAIIGDPVVERSGEWRSMVTRGIDRGELPPGTDPQLLLEFVRLIVDSRSSARRLDKIWLTLAVRTVIAGARVGTLLRASRSTGRSSR